MTPRWGAAPPADLLWIDWEGGGAVYHRPSGQTHFVNAATARMLRELLSTPAEARVVAAELGAAEAQLSDGGPVLEHVQGLLSRLEQLGLVERVQP